MSRLAKLCVAESSKWLIIDDCLMLKSLRDAMVIGFRYSWVYSDAVVSPVGIVFGNMKRVDVRKPLIDRDCRFLCSVKSLRGIIHLYDCESHWAIKAPFERSRAKQYSIIHKSQGVGMLLLVLSLLLKHYGMRNSRVICIDSWLGEQLKSSEIVFGMV